jgi:hypothetical protein
VKDQSKNRFNFPHIGIAVIDVYEKRLISQKYFYNNNFAFIRPRLSTNVWGDVAMAFCWGGGRTQFAHFGVGMLTGNDTTLYNLTPNSGLHAGEDYSNIYRSWPDSTSFCASCFVGDNKGVLHPYYVRVET